MPAPAVTAALLTGGAHVLSQGINAISQGNMNRKTRKWNEKMYNLQRSHALADWNLQNEYNHPSSQMARLREANLNPHLVYGHGNAVQSAGSPRGTDVKGWNPSAPQVDLGGAVSSGFGAYFNAEIKQAQLDNLRAQNTVIANDAALKAGQLTKILKEADKVGIWNKWGDSILKTSLEASQMQQRKAAQDIVFSVDENVRRAAMNASNLKEALARMARIDQDIAASKSAQAKIAQEINLMIKDGTLKDLEINLARHGIYKGDSPWARAAIQLFNQAKENAIYRGSSLGTIELPGGFRTQPGDAIRKWRRR